MKAIAIGGLSLAVLVSASLAATPQTPKGTAAQKAASSEPIQPIRAAKVTDAKLVELGKKLFFEPRLSKSGAISCNSCHNLSRGGSDNLTSSIGHSWQQGGINSPTVLNSSLNVAQFWDGRAKDLQAQAGGPIENPAEMASSHGVAVDTLKSIPAYRSEFKTVFGKDVIDITQVTRAIAAFEETLVTPNSRFDRWLLGDKKALQANELEGYQIFKSSGCTACHNGPAVGGNSFQKMGVLEEYHTANVAIGRAGVTGKDADRMFFKVPSLRNVELTGPYFHDGGAATLSKAVETMGRLQLGRKFTDEENAKVVAFLKTLTGDQPRIVLPTLPPSNDSTPSPQPFAAKPEPLALSKAAEPGPQ